MEKKRTHRGFLRMLVVLMLAACVLTADLAPAQAVTQADIDALKSDASGLKNEKKELQSQIDALSGDISNNIKKKELLDRQISVLSGEISNVEEQIAIYDQLIGQAEEELVNAQAREEAQYELFCQRVRAMEERGTVSYWSVLFKATDFADLLSRLDIINDIMDSDQRVIDTLQELQTEIAEKQEMLEGQKAESEAAKAELAEKRSELDEQREAANQLVKQLRQSQNALREDLDDLSAEEDAIQAEIVRLSRKLAEEEAARLAAAGQGGGAALGGYIWPVSSHYITSTFGGRESPGGIGSTNHKGLDIGRVGYTSPVYAAKAGTVIVSQYTKSYGNYVVVSHGSGNTTLYAHMSKRSVNVGDVVAQGATVGITGSTGNSTGPHLHFEITENGVRINPLTYLKGYTLSS